MKNNFTCGFYKTVLSVLFLFGSFNSFGDHIKGVGLSYSYVSGSTYKITLTVYTGCAPTATLSYASPQILIYNGNTYTDSIHLVVVPPDSGIEVTALCAADTTQCISTSSTIPGIRKYVYSGNYTLPSTSAAWRFIFNGFMGGAAAASREASITNLSAPGSTIIQLEDTLNNTVYNSTSPVIHSNLQQNVAINQNDFYSPFAVDSGGDALTFMLAPAMNGTESTTIGGAVGYVAGISWPGVPLSATTPMQNVLAGSFSVNSATGEISFYPTVIQNSVVVYNIEARRAGTIVGTSQVELTILALADTGSSSWVYASMPGAGPANYFKGCGSDPDTVRISGYATGCGLSGIQWQSSPDSITWTNISGATSDSYVYTSAVPVYYRCFQTSSLYSLTGYSNIVHAPASHYSIMQSTILSPTDTLCDSTRFYVVACDLSTSYSVKTWFGDGTSNNTALSTSGVCSANMAHWYSAPGIYLVKQVLYNSGSPVDSVSFSYSDYYCSILQAKFYYDADSNCVYGGYPDFLNNYPLTVEIDSNTIPIDTISATSGLYYKAKGGSGTIYSFKVLSTIPGLMVSCPTSAILSDTIQSSISTYPVKYFGLKIIPGTVFDLAIYDVIPVTGQHDEWGNIYVWNNYGFLTNATVTLNYSPKYNVNTGGGALDVNPLPTSYTSTSITWDLSGFSCATSPIDLYYAIWTDIGCCGYLTAGDTINSNLNVTPLVGDADISNNFCIVIDTVKAGCDPNEMSVSPAGCIAVDTVTKLQYTISFMNTGNDTAFNIYVMDTLSPNVNPHSLKLLLASAAMNIDMINDGVNNIVKFDFPGINLLDSAVCPHCSGAIIFDINTMLGLPVGATIFNHAGIFFDYNPVVMTNTVENIMGGCTTTSVKNSSPARSNRVSVYPNPATDELTIKMSQGAYTSFAISNSIGQEMIQQPLSTTQTQVNVKMLPAGVYYITFRGDNGTSVQKFVKG